MAAAVRLDLLIASKMSTEPSTLSNQKSDTADILIPVDTDSDPIIWDGNRAHILGNLHAVGKYYKRLHLFQPLLSDRAVALPNGKLAVESDKAVPFMEVISLNKPRTPA